MLVVLRLAKQMGVEAIVALMDSRLIANQIKREFKEKDKRMEKNVKAMQPLFEPLKKFTIRLIPRGENRRTDALSKLASTCFDHFSKNILVEVLKERSIDDRRVQTLAPTRHTWMTPIVEYLQHSILPDSHEESRKIRIKALFYATVDGVLYRKVFMSPWLKCVEEAKGKETLRETHAGSGGAHEWARALTEKIL